MKIKIILFSILILGLIIRYALSPSEGGAYDMNLNQGWARSAVLLGIHESYYQQVDDGVYTPNYLPVPIYLWAGAGILYKYFISSTYEYIQPTHRIFNKSPAIIADALICILLYLILSRWNKKKGLAAAAIYFFHPATFHNSAFWGQTDAIYTLFIVLALYFILNRKPFMVGCATALFCLSKPQAVIFMPVILMTIPLNRVFIRRFVDGLVATTLIIMSPFILNGSVNRIVDVYGGAIGNNRNISIHAYNFWWSILAGKTWMSDTEMFYNIITYRSAGIIIFSVLASLTIVALRKGLRGNYDKEKNAVILFSAAAVIANIFFMFNTEMHERYMFPFVALGIPFALKGWREMLLYIAISFAFFLNVVKILPWELTDRILFRQLPLLDMAIASWQVVFTIILLKMVIFNKDFRADCHILIKRIHAVFS